jgi:cell division protein ZapB
MDSDLKALEGKVDEFVGFCHRLQADNQQLRQQLASAVSESKRLEEKISAATGRLEGLLTHIPEDA